MQGFKAFLTRGNLVELAVAFIMGTAFATVVSSFAQIFLDLIGKVGGLEGLGSYAPHGVSLGKFLSALLGFVITGAALYFLVVLPYNRLSDVRKRDEPEKAASTEDLLTEIRDLLREH